MGLLHRRAGRLAAKNGGFRPGQGTPRSTYAAAVEQVVVAVGDGSRPRRGMKYARASPFAAFALRHDGSYLADCTEVVWSCCKEV